VLNQAKRRKEKGSSASRLRQELVVRPVSAFCLLPFAFCLFQCGCAGFWDDITSRDFNVRTYFVKPNPLLVLEDSQDGDKRAKALRALHEPKLYGGNDVDQDAVVKILIAAATSEKQPLCRLAAIEVLGQFKDPRAVDGLTTAFYNASSFGPDTATVIRCQAVTALGQTGNPAAVELLVKVVREPPAEGPETDRQQALDVRIAAARALGNFNHYQATEALVHVLQTDKDVALRDRAHESLQAATGKKLPPDAKAWEELLHQPGGQDLAGEPAKKPKFFDWF
jgi:HEAT repeat protein